MDFMDELKELGVNVQEGMDRVMGDRPLYEMMLGMFLDTLKNAPVRPEDFDGDDLDELTRRVHMLKGTAGNLSLMPLFDGYMEALTLLRAGQPARAKEHIVKMMPVQEEIVACIERHKGQQ